jgi:hypothetical protein
MRKYCPVLGVLQAMRYLLLAPVKFLIVCRLQHSFGSSLIAAQQAWESWQARVFRRCGETGLCGQVAGYCGTHGRMIELHSLLCFCIRYQLVRLIIRQEGYCLACGRLKRYDWGTPKRKVRLLFTRERVYQASA